MLPIDSHRAGSQHVHFSLSLPHKDLVNTSNYHIVTKLTSGKLFLVKN